MSAAGEISWESELAALLDRLSAAQRELLALLTAKRELIVRQDHAALAAMAPREHELAMLLRQCHEDRRRLLAAADGAGLPSGSIADLAAALPAMPSTPVRESLAEAQNRARIIRHECLTQWVVFQRTILHLSQLLEIIATGGRTQPTYEIGRARECGGALIDQAV